MYKDVWLPKEVKITKSLKQGTSKEKIGRKRYVTKSKLLKINFQCQEFGLFICQAYPYLGHSPDGVISCNCCGKGFLETKCPWNSREKLVSECVTQTKFCFIYDDSDKIGLKNSHPYLRTAHFTSKVCYRQIVL